MISYFTWLKQITNNIRVKLYWTTRRALRLMGLLVEVMIKGEPRCYYVHRPICIQQYAPTPVCTPVVKTKLRLAKRLWQTKRRRHKVLDSDYSIMFLFMVSCVFSVLLAGQLALGKPMSKRDAEVSFSILTYVSEGEKFSSCDRKSVFPVYIKIYFCQSTQCNAYL